MSSFSTYIIGSIIVIGGLAYAAFLLGAPPIWIGVGVVVALGLGIVWGTGRTKTKDPPVQQ